MCATVARQGGRVQLEQSDMRLALNMAKMAKTAFRAPQLTNDMSPKQTTRRGPRRNAAGC